MELSKVMPWLKANDSPADAQGGRPPARSSPAYASAAADYDAAANLSGRTVVGMPWSPASVVGLVDRGTSAELARDTSMVEAEPDARPMGKFKVTVRPKVHRRHVPHHAGLSCQFVFTQG
jgi:hypothetical protein